MRLTIAALALSLLPVHAAAQSRLSDTEAEILQGGLSVTADAFIQPAYDRFAAAADTLAATFGAFCDGTADRAGLHDAFADSFLAWQRASIVGLGPVMEAEGPMRFQLWPDPKGFSARAVRAAVNAADPALLEPGALDGRSVALINLTALEDLAHGDTVPGSYACDLGTAIARHQSEMAGALLAEWTPGALYRAAYDTAVAGNDIYPDVEALTRDLLAGLVVSADRVRKFKIARGLGPTAGDTHPGRTEATASGLGLASLRESFRAFADILEVPGGVFDMAPDLGGSMDYFMLGEASKNMADALTMEDRALTEIAAADGPMAGEIRRYGEFLLNQESFFKTEFLAAIGLTSGFTAADGD